MAFTRSPYGYRMQNARYCTMEPILAGYAHSQAKTPDVIPPFQLSSDHIPSKMRPSTIPFSPGETLCL